MYYNIGSYQKAIIFFRNAQQDVRSEKIDQYIVDCYENLITQIHIEYIDYFLPKLFESFTQTGSLDVEVIDIFKKPKPTFKEGFFSRYYYYRGLVYLYLNKRAKANQSFVESLAYDPAYYKSLLWLMRSLHDEFPKHSEKLITFAKSFAGVMPEVEKDKTYRYLMEKQE
jgi:tetratricopeptide (TPR) repeat protein